MSDFKKVTLAEFNEFLNGYPRPLVRDVAMMYEPPMLTYNDFALADKWPASVVAHASLDDKPEKRDYYILESIPKEM